MKKILLIEDSFVYSVSLTELLGKQGFSVEILDRLPSAPEDQVFQDLIARANEYFCVIWDGDIRGKRSFAGYIQAFAKVFKGPMFTFSASTSYCEKQMQAGCTHNTGKYIDNVVSVITDLSKTEQKGDLK